MIEDHELESWREEWVRVARPSPEFQRRIWQKVKRQERRFLFDNLLTAVVFVAILIFALVVVRHQSWLGTGWAAAIGVLVVVSAASRLWILRGTWRPEAQSTRAFVELWHRRVAARIRLLRFAIYVSLGWIVSCAVLTAANWTAIGPDVKAHPRDWLEVLIASLLMQPVLLLWAAWYRRRKLAELHEVKTILDEMKE